MAFSIYCMASADIDYMAIGVHCKVEGCHQLDFLPAKCSKCALVTCSQHASPWAHNCANVDQGNVCTSFWVLFFA